MRFNLCQPVEKPDRNPVRKVFIRFAVQHANYANSLAEELKYANTAALVEDLTSVSMQTGIKPEDILDFITKKTQEVQYIIARQKFKDLILDLKPQTRLDNKHSPFLFKNSINNYNQKIKKSSEHQRKAQEFYSDCNLIWHTYKAELKSFIQHSACEMTEQNESTLRLFSSYRG